MEPNTFNHEPPANFGKEVKEKETKAKKTKMNLIKISILVAGIAGLLVVFGGKADVISFAGNDGKNTTKKNKNMEVPVPDAAVTIAKKWDMPEVLKEISGLSYIDEQRFACVQDELGTIFIYNIASSKIEKEIPFGAPGDYEGIAVVNENIWVLRASGKLYEVNNINSATPSVKEYVTHLTIKQDSEGLCYDKKNNRLLIAIKGAEIGTEEYKGIYAFDLAARKMDAQPVFKINLLDDAFGNGKSGKKKVTVFNPSGITLHPENGDMYITDGKNSKLLITDAAGKIKKLYQLDLKEFPQPEGISFSPSAELFISNEGTKQAGNILKVKVE